MSVWKWYGGWRKQRDGVVKEEGGLNIVEENCVFESPHE
jgi:hypothetical protein